MLEFLRLLNGFVFVLGMVGVSVVGELAYDQHCTLPIRDYWNTNNRPAVTTYGRRQLLDLRRTAIRSVISSDLYDHLRLLQLLRRRRGCRGGRRIRTRVSLRVIPVLIHQRIDRSRSCIDGGQLVTLASSLPTSCYPRCLSHLNPHHRTVRSDRRQHNIDCLQRSRLAESLRTDSSIDFSRQLFPTLYLINACSLAKNNAIQFLSTDILNCGADIVLITETHFKAKHNLLVSNIDGFDCFRRDRSKRKGGGVCIYVRHELAAQVVEFSPSDQAMEFIWVKYTIGAHPMYVCCIYHPPKPLYNSANLVDTLCAHVDQIATDNSTAVIVLAGDFNSLNCTMFETDCGLTQLVGNCTRGKHTLDKIFTSRPDLIFSNKVIDSLIKSDHKAVVINSTFGPDNNNPPVCTTRPRRKVSFYDLRKQYVDALALQCGEYDWSCVLEASDVDCAYERFLSATDNLITANIPIQTVTVPHSTPTYVTPLIKSLLRKKNKLIRRGKTTVADTISAKIGKLISDTRANQLSNVNHKDIKKLWSSVRSTTSSRQRGSLVSTVPFGANDFVDYFTDICTDLAYDTNSIANIISDVSCKLVQFPNQTTTPVYIHQYEVFKCLSQVKKTSPGPDKTPYWLFKFCAVELTPIITHIINLTLTHGRPPSLWKRAIITPIPKVSHPTELSHFRPISVTPLISRIVERIIVNKFILPSLPAKLLADQFAYRPTCSTTAALIALEHHVAKYLESVSFVQCLSIDYSKAFDTISHPILFQKLLDLNLIPNVTSWIFNFLTGRTHSVSVGGCFSDWRYITASIVQGSGIGPCLFIVYTMGLKPLSVSNSILKYADDTYLLVPQHSSVTLQTEFSHILDWSSNNKLKLNTLKTKEIVFHRPRLPKTLFPPLLPGIERVDSIKILGVMFAHTMSPTQHIDYLISQCNQRLFLLSQLKYQNLSGAALDVIFHALIVSKITYALPAFAGHITVADKNRINKLFRKAFRRHLVNHLFDIDTLIVKHDSSLFRSLKYPDHCLHYLLPETRSNTMQLRLRGHNYTLAQIQTTLFKNSFIHRCLFNTI